jgi:hypothetical protein
LAHVAHQVAAESTTRSSDGKVSALLNSTSDYGNRNGSGSGNTTSSSIHQFSQAEKSAFVKHINTVLAGVPELNATIPVDPETHDIFDAVKDGVLLW